MELSREAGWATVREKLYLGELDAAQAPASMILELSLGYNGIVRECITGFFTAHNGNAITLSNELWELGVRDGESLARVVKENPQRRFTFAGVLKFSSQNYLMRHWLLANGVVPERDVNLVIVPPQQVHASLKNGYIDGYCVAEPWSSYGLLQNIGWCATLTSDFAPMHPEKVFMATKSFYEEEPARYLALLDALWKASHYCDQSQNRAAVAELLARPEYVDVSQEVLGNALVGPFQLGNGQDRDARDAIVFNRNDANRPSLQKAAWVLDQISIHKLVPNMKRPSKNKLQSLFREDVYTDLLTHLSPALTSN